MGGTSNSQDALNRKVYHAAGISQRYTGTCLETAEVVALLSHQPAFAGHSVLDLGIGTGRTIRFLRPLAGRYVCLDYSPEMVSAVRARYPEVDVRLADMRDLSEWGNGTFDFVLATNNLFDAVSHEDRLRTLSEVRRVLTCFGVLVFSSHNRRFRAAFGGPRLGHSRNPVTQAVNVIRYLQHQLNHHRIVRFRRIESDYALLDDCGHDYRLLHYYIDRESQRHQLDLAGFDLHEVLDSDGKVMAPDEDDSHSPTLMYVASRRC